MRALNHMETGGTGKAGCCTYAEAQQPGSGVGVRISELTWKAGHYWESWALQGMLGTQVTLGTMI